MLDDGELERFKNLAGRFLCFDFTDLELWVPESEELRGVTDHPLPIFFFGKVKPQDEVLAGTDAVLWRHSPDGKPTKELVEAILILHVEVLGQHIHEQRLSEASRPRKELGFRSVRESR